MILVFAAASTVAAAITTAMTTAMTTAITTAGTAVAGTVAAPWGIPAKPGPAAGPPSPEQHKPPADFRVMVFSKTAGFRHDSIPAGIEAIRELGKDGNFEVEATEDAEAFTRENLERFAAVVFLNTTGDVLARAQEEAFEAFISSGGGYVGVHSAADTEYDWEWYGSLVGAYFKTHPKIQEGVNVVEDRTHPSTHHLPDRWRRTDEWYCYRSSPRERVRVLVSLDETTYEGGSMGADHPISWCQEFGGGRSWYTGGGHTAESYSEPSFSAHLLGGILWAAGKAAWEEGEKGNVETREAAN